MRQRSIALQQAVAQSRLASAMAKSRFASVSRRLGSRLQPLVNPKVWLKSTRVRVFPLPAVGHHLGGASSVLLSQHQFPCSCVVAACSAYLGMRGRRPRLESTRGVAQICEA